MRIEQQWHNLSKRKIVALNILITSLYILFGNISSAFSNELTSFSPLWIPSGFALGIVIAFGLERSAVGLLAGMFFIAIRKFGFNYSSCGIVFSCFLEVVIGTILLKSFSGGKFSFKSPKDILGFILISCFLAPFVFSSVSTGFLYEGQFIHSDEIQRYWLGKFLSHALGALVITPLILSFFAKDSRKVKTIEAVVLNSILAYAAYWSFQDGNMRKFVIIPILTWAALRFGFRGISLGLTIVGYIAFWFAPINNGIFDKNNMDADLIIIQMVVGGAAIVGYFLATVVEAQETAHVKEMELTIKEDALAILDQSLHMSPIAFALIDKDFKYIRVNEALAKINGVDANAHLGKSISEIVPGISSSTIPMIQEVLRTGKSLMNIPYAGHTPNDPSVFVAGLVSYYPVRHPSNHEVFAVAFSFQDNSEQLKIQRLLTENQERMRFAQEAGKIGAFEWDISSGNIMWTHELEHIYLLKSGEFGGLFESWLKWIHPADLEEFKSEIEKVLKEEKELNYQFRIVTKNEETRWILARGKVIGECPTIKKLIGINIDITEQKQTEQKLRVTEANLLHALSVRDEFMAIASHELKTPLTSLKLANQFFQRGIIKNDPGAYTFDKINSFVEKNCLQVDRLTRLVDDMLDISRIRTGKFSLQRETCEISEMLWDILSRTKEQFDDCGSGQPIIENLETAYGNWDPLRIDQVLTNIIMNAIRYGKGKPIFISLKRYENVIRITVKDQGLGIPKYDQEKIFQRYERSILAREVSGLGLGLFITKQIVDAHGGQIWVESEVNHGATFVVDLPTLEMPVHFAEDNKTLVEV